MTRLLLLAAALVALPAHADMYRWIDRDTGAVKFSNTPPPWFGDPEKERHNPRVEVIRYGSTAQKPRPAPDEQKVATEARNVAELEARWLELARFFASLPPGTDLERAGPNIGLQLDSYRSLTAELDRLDPGGAERRRLQRAEILQSVRRGAAPERSPPPPAE